MMIYRIVFVSYLAMICSIGGLEAKPFIDLNTNPKATCRPSLWDPDCEARKKAALKLKKDKAANAANIKKNERGNETKSQDKASVIYVPVAIQKGEHLDPSTGEVINKDTVGQLLDEGDPKTSSEYISQEIWKNTPKKYLLDAGESKMLGELSPEGRNMPLPMLKFLLKPENETPAQTRQDYLQYKKWVASNMDVMNDFEKTFRQKGLTTGQVQKLVLAHPDMTKVQKEEAQVEVKISKKYIKVPGKDMYLLYFFNSTCPNCRKMTPNVIRLLAKLPEATVIGYSRDEPLEKSKKYAKKAGMTFDIVKPSKSVIERFHVDAAFPRLVIVDKITGASVTVKGYYDMSGIYRALNVLGKKRAAIVGVKPGDN